LLFLIESLLTTPFAEKRKEKSCVKKEKFAKSVVVTVATIAINLILSHFIGILYAMKYNLTSKKNKALKRQLLKF
jgi:ABC-type sugar transport system permease subunit